MQAVVLEDADPRVHAQQERGPERQDHQHQQDVAPAWRWRARCRRPSGSRSAGTASSRSPAIFSEFRYAFQYRLSSTRYRKLPTLSLICRISLLRPLEQRLVRRQRDLRLGEADLQHDQERDQEEQQQPQVRNGDDGGAARHAPVHEPRARPAIRRQVLEEAQQQAARRRYGAADAAPRRARSFDQHHRAGRVPVQLHRSSQVMSSACR